MKAWNGFLVGLLVGSLLAPVAASLGADKRPPAAPARAAAPTAPASLADRVAALVNAYEASAKTKPLAGVSIVDVATGKSLASSRQADLFIPASNQKLLSSAFALARLGGDFQFRTSLRKGGKDLWVIGSGDPTTGDPVLAADNKSSIYADLDRWAAAVKAGPGAAIEGDLVLLPCFGQDNKHPLEGYRHSDWPKNQYHTWYCAPVAGLNFNNNCFDVSLTAQGGKIRPVVSPTARRIQMVDALGTGGNGYWGLKYNADDSVVTVTGTAKAAGGETQSVAVNHPPLLLGRVLADRLEQAGVKLAGQVRLARPDETPPPPSDEIAFTATPIAAVMARANKRSLNMVAECLFLRAGDGTWAGSAALAAQTLVKEYGLDAGMIQIADGSGLGRGNKVAPAAMTRVLVQVLRRNDCLGFVQSLPFSGMDGTLAKRMDDPPYRGRVLGKTGYIAGVMTLSGYILDKENRCVTAYSVLCNRISGGAEAKKLQDDICKLLVDAADAPRANVVPGP